MNLLDKYKLLEKNDRNNVILFIAYIFFIFSTYMPYNGIITGKKIGETSYLIPGGEGWYNTIIYGYESETLLALFIITVFINAIGFIGNKLINKVFLLLFTVVYVLILLIIFAISDAGFGKPFGAPLYSGFLISLIGSIIILIMSYKVTFEKIN